MLPNTLLTTERQSLCVEATLQQLTFYDGEEESGDDVSGLSAHYLLCHSVCMWAQSLYYLSRCYSIAWDRLSDHPCHLCLYVRALTVAIFNRFWCNLAQTSGTWGSESNSLRVSPILSHFTKNWHLHNAFSMEVFKLLWRCLWTDYSGS